MATTQISVPDIDAKLMWRKLRALLWCILVALAVTSIILPNFEPVPFLAGLKNWLILIAVGVVAWPYIDQRFNV